MKTSEELIEELARFWQSCRGNNYITNNNYITLTSLLDEITDWHFKVPAPAIEAVHETAEPARIPDVNQALVSEDGQVLGFKTASATIEERSDLVGANLPQTIMPKAAGRVNAPTRCKSSNECSLPMGHFGACQTRYTSG